MIHSVDVFKSLIHLVEYSKFNLGWDIEKNPGPYPIYSIVKVFVFLLSREC